MATGELTWTREEPTEPGWYWYLPDEPTAFGDTEPHVSWMSAPFRESTRLPGQFSGPLLPPAGYGDRPGPDQGKLF